MSTTKRVVKKLALKRETVKGLSVKTAVQTGLVAQTQTCSSDWTQGYKSQSAASGIGNGGVDTSNSFHVNVSLTQVYEPAP